MAIKQLHHFMAKKMKRREFFVGSGLSLFAITGIAGIMTYFSNLSHPKAEHGFGSKLYGSGPYGK